LILQHLLQLIRKESMMNRSDFDWLSSLLALSLTRHKVTTYRGKAGADIVPAKEFDLVRLVIAILHFNGMAEIDWREEDGQTVMYLLVDKMPQLTNDDIIDLIKPQSELSQKLKDKVDLAVIEQWVVRYARFYYEKVGVSISSQYELTKILQFALKIEGIEIKDLPLSLPKQL
jgi:hypothetical protein